MHRPLVLVATLAFLLPGVRALAVVEAEMPLAQLVKDSQLIAVGKIEKLDRERGRAILMIERVITGSEPLRQVSVKLVADMNGEGDPQDMLMRVDDGMTLVVFLSTLSVDEYQLFAYGNGSWFKLHGTKNADSVIAQFLQGEPYLRKTWHGEAEKLAQLIADKAELSPIDKQQKPGLGPIVFGSSQTSPVIETTNEILLGPAWTTEGQPQKQTDDPMPGYVVGGLLAVAALGLVVMLTRSRPEVAQ